MALPKELSKQQRKELVEAFIQEFADQYQFPYTAAVHNHRVS
ncbi:mobA/MobL family protein [Acinetobacter sp. 1564232]|nr:mobA/MobL family protein [Acinetobacter sp. 1564232]